MSNLIDWLVMKQVLGLAGGQSDQLVGDEVCHNPVLTPL
jgi:hypothetical protein